MLGSAVVRLAGPWRAASLARGPLCAAAARLMSSTAATADASSLLDQYAQSPITSISMQEFTDMGKRPWLRDARPKSAVRSVRNSELTHTSPQHDCRKTSRHIQVVRLSEERAADSIRSHCQGMLTARHDRYVLPWCNLDVSRLLTEQLTLQEIDDCPNFLVQLDRIKTVRGWYVAMPHQFPWLRALQCTGPDPRTPGALSLPQVHEIV